MTLTKIFRRSATLCVLIVLALTAVATHAQAQAEGSPTACVGNDMAELKSASEAAPDNIGLRMRVIRLILDELPKTDNRRRSKAMLDDLQSQLDEIKKLDPEFTYVYRVLARQHERKGEFAKVIEVLDDYAKVTELDYDMRKMRVRALLRLGDDQENPEPKRTEEAAEYVANWFSSGTAPVFAETLASSETWMIDKPFRRALLKRFKGMYEAAPRNINLVISYASALYVAGRYETAWNVMHKAEKDGLCDDVMGGRHPLIHFLGWRCPEESDTEKYNGLDLDELRKLSASGTEDLSLRYRLAVRLKAKAYTGERLIAGFDEAVGEAEADLADAERAGDDPKQVADLKTRIQRMTERKGEIAKEVRAAYEEALPLAQAVRQANPQIDSVALLLADINSKLDNQDDAVKYLRESIERVPFFVPLRDKLAGIHADKGQWTEAANQLAGVCRLVSCRATEWDDEVAGAKLPVPAVGREQLIVKMAENAEARPALIKAFQEAIKKDPRNPNLQCFLAMIYYYAGDKANAAAWMLKAEALGVCGESGHEHELAVFIYTREQW